MRVEAPFCSNYLNVTTRCVSRASTSSISWTTRSLFFAWRKTPWQASVQRDCGYTNSAPLLVPTLALVHSSKPTARFRCWRAIWKPSSRRSWTPQRRKIFWRGETWKTFCFPNCHSFLSSDNSTLPLPIIWFYWHTYIHNMYLFHHYCWHKSGFRKCNVLKYISEKLDIAIHNVSLSYNKRTIQCKQKKIMSTRKRVRGMVVNILPVYFQSTFPREIRFDQDMFFFSAGVRRRFPIEEMLCKDCDDPGRESEWK